jgi:hypothetical protein
MDGSVVQDDFQEGFVYCDFAVVVYETEFPEFVHEEIHAGTGGADHFGADAWDW